jgi:hypothetical protein
VQFGRQGETKKRKCENCLHVSNNGEWMNGIKEEQRLCSAAAAGLLLLLLSAAASSTSRKKNRVVEMSTFPHREKLER